MGKCDEHVMINEGNQHEEVIMYMVNELYMNNM